MNDIEYVIHPHLSHGSKLVIGAQSVKLNCNCSVMIDIPKDVADKIKLVLTQCKEDLINAQKEGKLITADSKCNPCIVPVGTNQCKICGEFYQ